MIAMSQNNSAYQEDVSTLAAGSTIVAQPCRVYTMTFALEGAGDATISVSNSEGYAVASRVLKVVLTDEMKTHTVTFPTGKYFSTGVSATSNLAGVDVSVTYE
jgi:hypothetical protein